MLTFIVLGANYNATYLIHFDVLFLSLAGGGEHLLQSGPPRLRRSPSSSSGVPRQPYFRSHGQTYRIKEGEKVTMTCVVENLGDDEKEK